MEAVIGGTSPFSALLVPLPLLDSLTINGGTTGSNKHSGNIITDHSDGCSSVSINLGDFDPDRFLRQSNPPRWIALLAPSDQSPCSVCSVRRAMGQSGAAAVIFGSSRDRDDPIDCVDMPAPGRDEFKQQTLIPALRIAFDDYEFLLEETERLWMERKNRKKKLQLLRVRIVPDPNSAVLIFIIAWPFLVIGLYEIGYIVNARMSSYKNAIAVRNLPSKLWKQKNFERRQSDESSSVSTPCSVDENTMPIGFGDDLCAICLEDYIPGDRVRQLPCRHEFHADCVDRYVMK
ncbi:hypothetical protein HDU83_009466 [Entophlyctis luteolus]|nr:hypothetical protein HDU83_009466 [Entophlyctis luteolus]